MALPISVVIPVGPNEAGLDNLIASLDGLPKRSEVILAASQESEKLDSITPPSHLKLVTCYQGSGRAAQMNAGAKLAKGEWLWFLHADSVFKKDVLERLSELATQAHDVLYFHELEFLNDGPSGMRLNGWAVGWRSNVLKMPFGDQGFFLKRALFNELGCYREDLSYGEDHVFVWKARQEGVTVTSTGTYVATSARKYQNHGWLSTTFLHVRLTFAQAIPQYLILMKRRIFGVAS